MKMKQLRHEKKIYRELERMRKSRTFESSTDTTGQEPDDILNMSVAQRLRMIHAEKMSVPKAERKTPDAKADQLPLPTTLAVDFLPIKKIKNGTIYTDDGRYVKVLEVLPINFLLKSREEQEQVIYDFEKFLRIAPDNFQIKVLAKKTDISSYLQRLNENIACEPDEKCRAMMEDSRKLLIDLGQNEAISRRFFLAFEVPKQELRMQTEEEIERVLCRMRDRTLTYLQNCGNRVAILGSTTEETAKIFFIPNGDVNHRSLLFSSVRKQSRSEGRCQMPVTAFTVRIWVMIHVREKSCWMMAVFILRQAFGLHGPDGKCHRC